MIVSPTPPACRGHGRRSSHRAAVTVGGRRALMSTVTCRLEHARLPVQRAALAAAPGPGPSETVTHWQDLATVTFTVPGASLRESL
jgi:hypothetical protein